MHLYLNYAREHWTHAAENPPVGLILCAQKDEAVAHYSLDNLLSKERIGQSGGAEPASAVVHVGSGRKIMFSPRCWTWHLVQVCSWIQ